MVKEKLYGNAMFKAKCVMPDKFWLLEDSKTGLKRGTIQLKKNSVVVLIDNRTIEFEDILSATEDLHIQFESPEEVVFDDPVSDIYGFPVNCLPFSPLWDVQKKLPVFTKSDKSKSLHAAGFYIIKFDRGWVQSFCPKLTTLTGNDYEGPFKTKIECRERLRIQHND